MFDDFTEYVRQMLAERRQWTDLLRRADAAKSMADFPDGITTTDCDFVGWKRLRDCRQVGSTTLAPCVARVLVPKGSVVVRPIKRGYRSVDLRANAYFMAGMTTADGRPCVSGRGPVYDMHHDDGKMYTGPVDTDNPDCECEPGFHFYPSEKYT